MMRKLALVSAFAAALLLPITAFAAEKKGAAHGAGRTASSSGARSSGRSVAVHSAPRSVARSTTRSAPRAIVRSAPTRRAVTTTRSRPQVSRQVTSVRGSGHHHSHKRHFWHGRWWNYGIPPCWEWSDDYDEYVWVCD